MRINATNHMLCWNTDSADVKLVPWPDTKGISRAYDMSGLACYKDIRGMTFEQRKIAIFVEAMCLIIRDHVNPSALHKELYKLEEYKDALPDDLRVI
jgi:hypothetical protein